MQPIASPGEPRQVPRWLAVLAVTVFAVVAVAAAARLLFGVDLADEGFYAALPYRFVLGDRPFIDEMHILQLAGFLTFPLVKAFIAVKGSTEGLILALRAAWLLAWLALCGAGFRFLRRFVAWPWALLGAAVPLVAIPFNIPAFSYNTMGAGLLTLGVLLGAEDLLWGRSRWWMLGAGVAHGLAVVAYPTLLFAMPAFGVGVAVVGRGRGWGGLWAYLLGGLVVGAPLAAYLFGVVGLGNVLAAWRFMSSQSGYGGAGDKLPKLAGDIASVPISRVLVIPGLVLLGLAMWRWGERARPWLLLSPLMMLVVFGTALSPRTLGFVFFFCVLGIFLYFHTARDALARGLLVWALLAPLFAGAVTAYSSTNGFMNAGIGAYPAVFAATAMLALAVTRPDKAEAGMDTTRLRVTLGVVCALSVLLGLTWSTWAAVYNDESVPRLTAVTPIGPYARLLTTPSQVKVMRQLQADLASHLRPGDRVLFFDEFPSGYLFTSARPDTNTLWLTASGVPGAAPEKATLAYLARNGLPDVVVQYRWQLRRYGPGHVLAAFFAPPRYTLSIVRRDYRVWVLAGH